MTVDVLVCNLTRFGDLIQTQPLFDDLHSAGLSAGLVCLENFTSAAALLRHVDRVWPFPAAAILAEIEKSWLQAAAQTLELANAISGQAQARYVLNLTPTVPARMLSYLIAGNKAQLMGFAMDADGYGLNTSIWASFLAVAAGKRANSPFNVADMLRNTALDLTGGGKGSHVLALPDSQSLEWAKKLTDDLRKSHNASGFMAFQPGASEDARRWPVKYFARLGQILWEKLGLMPILTGAPNESALAAEYGKLTGSSHPFFSAIGKTDFNQLAALLRECELLVTNDTGTMHLAAGQGLPILAFFLATAQAFDTAPLQPGSACLEPALSCHPCAFGTSCAHHECREGIKPEAAAQLILNWHRSGKWLPDPSSSAQYRLWITGRDEHGLNYVLPQGSAANEDRTLWFAILRDFWSQTLDKLSMAQKRKESWGELNLSQPLPATLANCILTALQNASQLLASIVELGAITPKSPAAGHLMLKNASRAQQILDECAPLATLGAFWRELYSNSLDNLSQFLPLAQTFAKACALLREALLKKGADSCQS